MPFLPVYILASLSSITFQQTSPFEPPNAKLQLEPKSNYDLQHVAVNLDIDYPNRTINGSSVNRIKFMEDGATKVKLDCSAALKISKVTVNGKTANSSRTNDELWIEVGKQKKGAMLDLRVVFSASNQKGSTFGAGGGWHWIEDDPIYTSHQGFWTQGESVYNREWCPTWDYPNDFATSESTVTVPADWTVVGNGTLTSNVKKANKRTFHWQMSQPHATYLLSLVGGPVDVGHDTWRGKELWYVVPKNKGNLIEGSFGDTKDMLEFYSQVTGFVYAWPKYAQNAMYDFGGGMENVSATTLGEGSLTDGKAGFRDMASLNAHELAHQWFGDTVTCRDWGHIWLNESFATFMEAMYMEHSRGLAAYQREIDGDMQSYFFESRRYQRPIMTNMYSHPDAMFDSHTYPKGAAVLHTLRRKLGDTVFWGGIKNYLNKWKHTPVVSDQLCAAMSEVAKQDLKPFWNQWIYKPGHPVLEYTWSTDGNKLAVEVKQTQNTSKGAPYYDIETWVGVVQNGSYKKYPIHLKGEVTKADIQLSSMDTPETVILDPGHDFLREMKHEFNETELMAVFKFAPHVNDRFAAWGRLAQSLNDEKVAIAMGIFKKDTGQIPLFSTQALMGMQTPEVRAFFVNELNHKSYDRRATAIRALSEYGFTSSEKVKVKSFITNKEFTPVVLAALSTLDKAGEKGLLELASNITSQRFGVESWVMDKLIAAKSPKARARAEAWASSSMPETLTFGFNQLSKLPYSAKTGQLIKRALGSNNPNILRAAFNCAKASKDKALIPSIEAATKREKFPKFVANAANDAIKSLKGE